jgi:hypothetical protein
MKPAEPDRPPTPDEERAAERAAEDVDIERVAEHEREMLERGANVEGEGQIEPNSE